MGKFKETSDRNVLASIAVNLKYRNNNRKRKSEVLEILKNPQKPTKEKWAQKTG